MSRIDECAAVAGGPNRFSRLGFASAELREIAPGLTIRTLLPRFLLASKIEAYRGRGETDPYASKDLEDIVALVDGADGLVEQVQAEDDEVRRYVAAWSGKFLAPGRASPCRAARSDRGSRGGAASGAGRAGRRRSAWASRLEVRLSPKPTVYRQTAPPVAKRHHPSGGRRG